MASHFLKLSVGATLLFGAHLLTQGAVSTGLESSNANLLHPEFGEVWRMDLDLSTLDATRFVLHQAAADLAGKGLSTIIVAMVLAALVLRYGTRLWLQLTKTEISMRGLKVGIALLLPLAFASHVVGAARDFAADRIPEEEIARWKYGTSDLSKVPRHIEHNVQIPI